MEKKKALLIVNPYSGKMRVKPAMFAIIDELNNAGYMATVRLTEYAGHATEIASNVKPGEYDIVICSGGDGTLNETANGLIRSGSNIRLGYIPTGSTNDFANTLGMSKDIKTAIHDIATGECHKLDMGSFGGRVFSYVASFGIFTKASYCTDQVAKNLLGRVAYVLEGVKDIADVHEYHMIIDADGKRIEDTFIFGAIANSTSLGGIITLDPEDVCLDDGLFEYLFIKKPNNISELAQAISAISSYDYQSDRLYFGSAANISICLDQPVDWSLDGEYAQSGNKLMVSNLHHAISIVLPQKNKQLTNYIPRLL